ncbi:uncharacterized protein MKK02DRAFT_41297 [Dioszegia hungarica]|uniref:Uncharacterized protein n=1 Tax=Dioszegia hungarica TaxID=4972 RepID=A0AA38H0L4_9TREE|nr:uncharacterized protein MKK02DRAFT_41297 [Dioszegia hungarica]KAI9632153.1 hypothetical protein MKK02DRAFT_41297 [Dioszegia hungarica]
MRRGRPRVSFAPPRSEQTIPSDSESELSDLEAPEQENTTPTGTGWTYGDVAKVAIPAAALAYGAWRVYDNPSCITDLKDNVTVLKDNVLNHSAVGGMSSAVNQTYTGVSSYAAGARDWATCAAGSTAGGIASTAGSLWDNMGTAKDAGWSALYSAGAKGASMWSGFGGNASSVATGVMGKMSGWTGAAANSTYAETAQLGASSFATAAGSTLGGMGSYIASTAGNFRDHLDHHPFERELTKLAVVHGGTGVAQSLYNRLLGRSTGAKAATGTTAGTRKHKGRPSEEDDPDHWDIAYANPLGKSAGHPVR